MGKNERSESGCFCFGSALGTNLSPNDEPSCDFDAYGPEGFAASSPGGAPPSGLPPCTPSTMSPEFWEMMQMMLK